jgi:hypothetical protein
LATVKALPFKGRVGWGWAEGENCFLFQRCKEVTPKARDAIIRAHDSTPRNQYLPFLFPPPSAP